MSNKMRYFVKLSFVFWAIPFYIIVYLLSSNKKLLNEDLLRANKRVSASKHEIMGLLTYSIIMNKTFRNIYYLQCGYIAKPLSWILPPVPNIELCKNIQGGLVLLHGFSVVINPKVKIGRNCTILQNVTIGDVKGGVPTIGDNVSIGAGAILIGNIHIGNNVKIGAGAIVVSDIPDGATAKCAKATISYNN